MQIFRRTVLCFVLLLIPAVLSAQHLIVDDAVVVQKHLFEAWGGTEESWIQPSFVLNRGWNLSPGIIFNTSNQNIDATHWLIESKVVPSGLSNNMWGVGNVSALVFDFDGDLTQIYSYIPVSRNILNPNSFVHLNVGIEANHLLDDWVYAFTTGFRADLAISERVILLSEIFSYDFNSTGFQAGLRFVIIPGQLESDITYGRGFEEKVTYPGFNVGISFTPYSN
jgi:hypothetical protein